MSYTFGQVIKRRSTLGCQVLPLRAISLSFTLLKRLFNSPPTSIAGTWAARKRGRTLQCTKRASRI